jgi:gliding motility-associated-like protein
LVIKKITLLVFALLSLYPIFAQDYGAVEFVENKGQWDGQVRFAAKAAAGGVFLHNNGFTILQHHPRDWETITEIVHKQQAAKEIILGSPQMRLRSHAYRVEFLNASSNAVVVPDKAQNSYNNYFIGSDPAKWASNCKIFGGVTVKGIYPGIDVRYYSNNGQMKYDLIVAPGADVSQIALKYTGIDKLEVKGKELIIGTSVGALKELAPYSYQPTAAGRQEVTARYVVKGNELRFQVKSYDRKALLVIDPTLIFCSFSGSTADNWGFTATYGPDGSMYGGGVVDKIGFPVSTGAIQTAYAGGRWDIGLIKLSPDGTQRIYATYLGGEGIEQPHSLIVDAGGNLVMAGRTNSNTYPVLGPGKIGPGGNYDIVVSKLNADGTALIGSLKIGGAGDDGVNIDPGRDAATSLKQNYGDDGRSEVIVDGSNNIYVASCTKSINFPVVNGFQKAIGGKDGDQDGVVLKLTPNVSGLLFSSYLGGDANDAAYVLSLNPFDNNIYVGGGTESKNFPGVGSGSISGSRHGLIDGFVSIISNNGAQLLKSTYIGTTSIDQVFGVQFDKFGFPYIMGQTNGSWPTVNAPWSQAGGKQFIAKLQPDLSAYVYSTMFGSGSSTPNISPVAFLVDRCENVYVSGWGGSLGTGSKYPLSGTSGLTVTPDAIKSTTDFGETGIGQDFYFFVLRKDATAQLYGSFFGQNGGASEHVDGGTSRFDRNGVIYQAICANCKYGGVVRFPTTPGAWSTTNPSQQCNLAMVKIAFNLAGIRSGVQSAIEGVPRDTAGCVPLTIDFRDTVQRAVSYEWNFGDGSEQVTTTTPAISHVYNRTGSYRVMLVAIDSTTCNIRDTSYITVKAGDVKATLDFNPVKLEPCQAFEYRFDNTSFAPPVLPFSATAFEWDFGDGTPRVIAGAGPVRHRYAAAGTYNVRLILRDTGYCNSPDDTVKQLRVSATVKARIETPRAGCAPYTALFSNVSEGGQEFLWSFGDGATSNAINPSHEYPVPGRYTVRLIAIDPNTCNRRDSTEITIEVFDKPQAGFTAAPQPPTVNTPVTFTNTASPDAIRFKYLFGDGDSLLTNSRLPVQHEYNTTGTFQACQIAINAIGCADTVCSPVQTLIEPAIDVPNAFTPRSGDMNSIIYAKGYGIARMKFTIWNRWGQKVFESNSKNIGWDGKFKGVLQPMDVYAYTLDVEFTDGTKANKKGDITLIR